MNGKRHLTPLIATLILVLAVFGAAGVSADAGANTYEYLVGSGLLCSLGPGACPDVARAPNGDTIELAGQGTFSIHPKSVTGGGTFTHRDAAGNVLGSGTWTATQLLGFHSYGSGAAQGLPSEFTGGLVLIRVHLSAGFDAILQVDCAIGDQIPGGAIEGVRLAVQGGLNFNEEVSGLTVFIQQ